MKKKYKIAHTAIIMAINAVFASSNLYAENQPNLPIDNLNISKAEQAENLYADNKDIVQKNTDKFSDNILEQIEQSGQSKYNIIETVVVSAAKVPQKLEKAIPAVISIDLKKSNPNTNSIADILKQQLGIEVKQAGGMGAQTSLFMRSSGSSQSLVLLDGVPVNSLSSGGTSIERLSLNNITSAEAVSGSVSSLYGSNAMGGVVNFTTLPKINLNSEQGRQTKYSADIKVKGGTDSSYGINSAFNGQYYNSANDALTSYGLKISGFETNGIDAMNKKIYPNSNPDKDSYSQKSAGLYLQHEQNNNLIAITAGTANTKADYDNAYDLPSDTHKYESTFNNIGLNFSSKFNDNLRTKFTLGYNQENAIDYKNDKQTSQYTNTNKYASLQADYLFNPDNIVSVQAERLNQDLDSDSKYQKTHRQTNSLRLGYAGQIDVHSIQANIRYDDISDIKHALTYFAGYGFNITPAWKIFASHSTGFRAAGFNELYGPFGGNPSLNTEHSKNAEIGTQYAQNGVLWRTSLYQNRYKDLIGYDSNYKPVNINKAKISGVESFIKTTFAGLNFSAGINWQNPQQIDITPQGEQKSTLLLRSKLFGNIGADYTFKPNGKNLIIGGNVQFTGNKQDYGSQKLGGYALVDLSADYALTKDLSLQAGIKNLLNRKNIFDAYGYNKPERKAFIQLSYTTK